MTLPLDEDPHAGIRAFVDELARAGVAHACLCPGSRSTPLALTLRRHRRIRLWTHLDERAAAFFALGMAKSTGRPVALVCTSGTAAVNFAPAVVEAWHARVPLLVLTADRPPELRDVGALQTIDQVRLYGPHVKWSSDLSLPERGAAGVQYARAAAARAVAIATGGGVPGPVHLNFPLREPLIPLAGARPTSEPPPTEAHDANSGRWPSVSTLPAAELDRLARTLEQSERGLIICGPQDDRALPSAVTGLAERLRFPLLADALSGTRCGPHHSALVIDSHDAFLRSERLVRELTPDVIVRFGAPPVSKPALAYLEAHRARRHILVDAGLPGRWPDPTLTATDTLAVDPTALCQAVVERVAPSTHDRSSGSWLDLWLDAARNARTALDEGLDAEARLSEPGVVRALSMLLPAGSTLFAGNSMPVRDVDTFFPGSPHPVDFLANRGASGIDGVVSTALGAGAAGRHPLVLIVGDLSFYHDMNGLLAARRHGLAAVIVLLNNDGGGIFSLLPQADDPEHFEELFGTPHGLDFEPAAELYGLRYCRAGALEGFRTAFLGALDTPGVSVIEVRTERERNADLHRRLWSRAVTAVETAMTGSVAR